MTEILSLSTLTERDTIRVESSLNPEGRLYELRNVEELSVIEFQTIVSRQKQAEKAERTADKVSPADARRMTESLNHIVGIVVPTMEPEVVAELTDMQKAAITDAWARQLDTPDAEGNGESRSIGAD